MGHKPSAMHTRVHIPTVRHDNNGRTGMCVQFVVQDIHSVSNELLAVEHTFEFANYSPSSVHW